MGNSLPYFSPFPLPLSLFPPLTECLMAEISPAQSLKEKIGVVKHVPVEDPDAEFGGIEERRRIERKLLWKLDCRMFIVVIMHILDHVSTTHRLTNIDI